MLGVLKSQCRNISWDKFCRCKTLSMWKSITESLFYTTTDLLLVTILATTDDDAVDAKNINEGQQM